MPRTDARGGPQTRDRISNVATRLFLERGFDAVTVAEVAREAGVSSVTVFNHFPRKEDLLLDRAGDAVDYLRSAIRDRGPGVDVLTALHDLALRLVERRDPFATVNDDAAPFFRAVAGSPALLSRAREISVDLQRGLADELYRDAAFDGDSALFAALFIAGYTTVMVENARRLIAEEPTSSVEADVRGRLDRLFSALRNGVLNIAPSK